MSPSSNSPHHQPLVEPPTSPLHTVNHEAPNSQPSASPDPSNNPSSALPQDSPQPSHVPALTQPSHPMVTRAKAGVFKPKVWTVDTSIYWTKTEPTRVKDALSIPHWRAAMDDEYLALMNN